MLMVETASGSAIGEYSWKGMPELHVVENCTNVSKVNFYSEIFKWLPNDRNKI